MQAFRSRSHVLLAFLVLGLGLVGVAFAQSSSGSSTASVTLMDGKLKISQTTFPPGKLTLVVTNQGKLSHGLAIMGSHFKPEETPTIGSGKTARLTVTLPIGMYHIWDPVRSSMSHATMLTVKKAASGVTTPSTAGNTTISGGSNSPGGDGADTSGGSANGDTTPSSCGGMGGMNMPGMDPKTGCAGMGGM